MNANTYQMLAIRTLLDEPGFTPTSDEIMLVWLALGLSGEVGEITEHIKKGIFHQHGVDKDKLVVEIGDVLWYIAALCQLIDRPLSQAMRANIVKLQLRYPTGFNPEASQLRRDVR